MYRLFYIFFTLVIVLSNLTLARGEDSDAISPKDSAIKLFNGKNLDGLYTWMSDTKYEDPRRVFTVEDGMLHISGDGFGYIATKQRYKNYHLVAEYRWGDRTWKPRKNATKDSGMIVHCLEPDGCYQNVYMAGIEAQVIEGGTGDILVVSGVRPDGVKNPVSLVAETIKHGNAIIWKKGEERKKFSGGRIDWWGRDPAWKDTLGFRGKFDLDSPGKEWTRLDVFCDGGRIVYRVNGVLANEGFDSQPSAGKILFQTEGAEIFVRRWELLPLVKTEGADLY